MSDAEQFQPDPAVPMIKEETTKDDGRTLIYYTFPETQTAPMTPEEAHV